jgi:hypothetical protein
MEPLQIVFYVVLGLGRYSLSPPRGLCGAGGENIHETRPFAVTEGKPTDEGPIGGPLVLRHASKRSSGTWGPNDYDVVQDGRDIGRIFYAGAGVPLDRPWMWTITGAVVMPALPAASSHGGA